MEGWWVPSLGWGGGAGGSVTAAGSVHSELEGASQLHSLKP